MTEEQKQLIEQFIDESEHYQEVAANHGKNILNEVVYALQQAELNNELLMSLFEDSGMWRHAMCLNDITLIEDESN
jgi:phosphoserine aminotransferase